MSDEIRIGATGFAECALAYPKISFSKVRPFKFKTKGEGAGRSGYYKKALDTIRHYHASNNDRAIFKRARQELGALYSSLDLEAHLERTKIKKNIEALVACERIYGARLFQLHPRHHLSVQIGDITVTAQPDLWASENGVEVLIKIGNPHSLWRVLAYKLGHCPGRQRQMYQPLHLQFDLMVSW